jgi:hypothetical protein
VGPRGNLDAFEKSLLSLLGIKCNSRVTARSLPTIPNTISRLRAKITPRLEISDNCQVLATHVDYTSYDTKDVLLMLSHA